MGQSTSVLTFAERVLKFNRWLQRSELDLPRGIDVLLPFTVGEVQRVNREFYLKYFNDANSRIAVLGINPGRLGAGITGIPFTDPVQLEKACGIPNGFTAKGELSSEFIYRMISSMGTLDDFYQRFYISSVCPLGFVKNGVNLNYYDEPALEKALLPFIHQAMVRQLKFGCRRDVAFVLGEGKNFKSFSKMNETNGYFDELIPLPHPRFIMQYRRKEISDYLEDYRKKLTSVV